MAISNLFGEKHENAIEGVCDALLGNRIGSGAYRTVFPLLHNRDLVCKVIYGRDLAPNILEYEVWHAVQYEENRAKWFAACDHISDNGRALIQERLAPFASQKDPRLPEKIPAIFTDTKAENWGVDKDGNVKCMDYGSLKLLQPNPFRMVKAKWWDTTDYDD